MWFIYDNLRVQIMAGVVLFMLLSATTQVREASVEQLSIYAAKKYALDLADWLENDISTLGSNFDSTTVRFLLPTLLDGNTTDFTFLRDTLGPAPNFNPVRIETRYQLIDTDMVELEDSMVQMYQVVRSYRVQEGSGWTLWQEDGRSTGRMSYFMVSLLDTWGAPVVDEAETVFLKMDFSVIPPFRQGKQYLNQLSWGTTVRLRPY